MYVSPKVLKGMTADELKEIQTNVIAEMKARHEKKTEEAYIKAEEIAQGVGLSLKGLVAAIGPKGITKDNVLKFKQQAGKPKYQISDGTKTWTGKGRPPGWILSATDKEALLIKTA